MSLDEQPQSEEPAGFFDGELLARNLNRFLSRMNHALKDARASLPDFDVKEVTVALAVDAHGEIGFLGAGVGFSRERSLEFILTPKP